MHPERPPDVPKLIAALAAYDVRYVLVGSVAAAFYGVETVPEDLDITPALDRDNLLRLTAMLEHLGAEPSGVTGHWTVQPGSEEKWTSNPLTAGKVTEFREAWQLYHCRVCRVALAHHSMGCRALER